MWGECVVSIVRVGVGRCECWESGREMFVRE